jgi:hypothetical protein
MAKHKFYIAVGGLKSKIANGQAMILTVLMIGGTILAATTVAGLLLTYQIRQSTNFANSAKAVFAADTGIEWGLYEHYFPASSHARPGLANGADFNVYCYDSVGATVDCGDASTILIKSIGSAGDVRRAFAQSL